MKDISVEYSHIYTNQKIAEEHEFSLGILTKLRQSLEKENKTYNLVIMVDDYSFPDPTFSYDEFSEWLAEQGHKPNFIIRESQLIPVCDEVLKMISSEKLKEQIVDYTKAKKYPCSLFIVAWYLLRLGYLKNSLFDVSLQAKNLINILPTSFKPFEDKALEIIKSTQFSEAISKIEYKFFEGRLVY